MSARVLLVEDEVDARELLVRGLRRCGMTVEGAADGAEALERLVEPWDVIVTDLLMPRVDGLRLLEVLQARRHPALRVVITSFGDKERVLAALNSGADHLLEKPFAVDRLHRLIERLLAERGAGQAAGVDQLFQRRLEALPLTPRERELVVYVLKGLPNRDIARLLGIGEQTVKNALSALYAKLGIASRGELFHLVFPI